MYASHMSLPSILSHQMTQKQGNVYSTQELHVPEFNRFKDKGEIANSSWCERAVHTHLEVRPCQSGNRGTIPYSTVHIKGLVARCGVYHSRLHTVSDQSNKQTGQNKTKQKQTKTKTSRPRLYPPFVRMRISPSVFITPVHANYAVILSCRMEHVPTGGRQGFMARHFLESTRTHPHRHTLAHTHTYTPIHTDKHTHLDRACIPPPLRHTHSPLSLG